MSKVVRRAIYATVWLLALTMGAGSVAMPDGGSSDADSISSVRQDSPDGSPYENPGRCWVDVPKAGGAPPGGAVSPLEATYHLFGLALKFFQPTQTTELEFQFQDTSVSFESDWGMTGTGTREERLHLRLDLDPPGMSVGTQTGDPFSGTYALNGNCELTGLDDGAATASVSPDRETLHLVSGFDEPDESGRSLHIGLAEGDSLTTDSVSGRYHFFGLEGQMSAQPELSTGIGAQGQILVIDFDAGSLTSPGTFEESARLNLDEVPPSLDVTSEQTSPFTGTYSVTPDGQLTVDGLTMGRVSPDGNTLLLEVAFDEPGQSGRGVMVGVREGTGLGPASITGTYRFHGLSARLSTEPLEVAAQSQRVELTFDGAGGFTDSGTEEETAALVLDEPQTLDLRSEVSPPGAGTYTVGSTGEMTLSADGETFTGWVGPDGDTILIFAKRDEPGEANRALYIATRAPCLGADVADELVSDFGDGGLWHYDQGTWAVLTAWDAEAIEGWGDTLAADFGSGRGLWVYDSGRWSKLAGWDPEIIHGWGDTLAADFGVGRGLWVYGSAGWSRLTTWDSIELDVVADELCVAFDSGRGLWCHDTVDWNRLTPLDPEQSEPVNFD